MNMMRVARMHEERQPFSLDTVPVPEPRPADVLVQVKACGVVPNLRNVVDNSKRWRQLNSVSVDSPTS
jgi:NADPH:quinone reductase-like Zn-dependent oxidoreductase